MDAPVSPRHRGPRGRREPSGALPGTGL